MKTRIAICLRDKVATIVPNNLKGGLRQFYFKLSYLLRNVNSLFLYRKWDFFPSVAIETTTYCNFRCNCCPNSKHERGLLKNEKLMDINLFKKIIDELSENNFRGLIFLHWYGEPLTDKRLPELVFYISKKVKKSKIRINTNGSLLTTKLYKKLVEFGVDSFNVTQYGTSVVPNMKKIFKYLGKRPINENRIDYRVMNDDTPMSNRGGELKVKNVVDIIKPICTYPNTPIHIDYNGNVVLCCNDYHSSVTFGNLRSESLIDIWDKKDYKNLRKELKRGVFKLNICKKCVNR